MPNAVTASITTHTSTSIQTMLRLSAKYLSRISVKVLPLTTALGNSASVLRTPSRNTRSRSAGALRTT